MTGRDPDEPNRAASPLELLFDLSFVAAFNRAADEAAHFLAEAHVGTAIVGFVFVSSTVCWAWVNFSWFASAFDTDDWFFPLTTMVQMVGVLILALGTHRCSSRSTRENRSTSVSWSPGTSSCGRRCSSNG